MAPLGRSWGRPRPIPVSCRISQETLPWLPKSAQEIFVISYSEIAANLAAEIMCILWLGQENVGRVEMIGLILVSYPSNTYGEAGNLVTLNKWVVCLSGLANNSIITEIHHRKYQQLSSPNWQPFWFFQLLFLLLLIIFCQTICS